MIGALMGGFASDLAAQAPAPAQLAVERASFLRQVLEESRPLTEQYERALAKLEMELAGASDYEEALRVQQRRAELKALYPNSDLTSNAAQSILLMPSAARLNGSTEARGDTLTGWRTGGSGAEWQNVRVPAGRYYLELEANLVETPILPGSLTPGRAQPEESAAFEFFEVSLLPGAEENRRSFEIKQSPDDLTFSPIRIGPVNFTRSSLTLRLSTSRGYPGNVVRLRNPRLTPVTEEITTAPSLSVPGITLDDLRKDLASSLEKAQKPIIDAYLTQLRILSAGPGTLRPEADAEVKRILKLMDSSRNSSALGRLLIGASGVGGFEDLDGARFVADAANSGDRFMVEHDGRRFILRLLWVQCAPLNATDSNGRKTLAKHFELSEDDLPALARSAQEFTAGYLEGKMLRLLVRPAKEKDGAQPALVFLPEVGLYQNVLIDQGLAAVQTPPKELRRGGMEQALLSALQEREESARRQKTGAWALGTEEKK